MTVLVDNMAASFGRMQMCHMTADSTAELVEMAAKIGVAKRWIQHPGTPREHFDICLSKRAAAIAAGANECAVRDTVLLVRRKRAALATHSSNG